MKFVYALIIALFGAAIAPHLSHAEPDPVAREIGALFATGVPLRHNFSPAHMDMARRFYARRQSAPLWWTGRDWREKAIIAQRVLANAEQEGLRRIDYAAGLRPLPSGNPAARSIAEADVLLTAALLRYISDIGNGRRRPHEIDPEMHVSSGYIDPVNALNTGMAAGDFSAWLHGLAPVTPGYAQLREALARMRLLAATGAWPELPDGPKLEMGMQAADIAILRQQLTLLGDLQSGLSNTVSFDAALAAAVKAFQARHGLAVDGVVGHATRRALNVHPSGRIKQIILNMERLRWLEEDFGPRFVLVNIASFELIAVDHGEIVIRSPVVVGRSYRRTPVFSDQIVNLVLSPTWTPPPRLAKLDVLPKIKANPAYLKQQGFRVFEGWKANARELDPGAINWRSVTERNLSFRLRQDPGPLNALGGVRFSLTNSFGIYLHDTPARELFNKPSRGFSSGCIRVAKAAELALFALENDADWPPARLTEAMTSAKTQIVKLAKPLPIHIIYHTAWVDSAGVLQFRDDIYGRDALLRGALNLDAAQ